MMKDIVENTKETGAVARFCGKEVTPEMEAQIKADKEALDALDLAMGDDGEEIFRNAVRKYKPKEKELDS